MTSPYFLDVLSFVHVAKKLVRQGLLRSIQEIVKSSNKY